MHWFCMRDLKQDKYPLTRKSILDTKWYNCLRLKRRETAEYIKLSRQQISRYERGASKINISHLVDIAVFLETPIAWFFQDCLPAPLYTACTADNAPEQQWNSLNPTQKAAFAAFLDTLRNP